MRPSGCECEERRCNLPLLPVRQDVAHLDGLCQGCADVVLQGQRLLQRSAGALDEGRRIETVVEELIPRAEESLVQQVAGHVWETQLRRDPLQRIADHWGRRHARRHRQVAALERLSSRGAHAPRRHRDAVAVGVPGGSQQPAPPVQVRTRRVVRSSVRWPGASPACPHVGGSDHQSPGNRDRRRASPAAVAGQRAAGNRTLPVAGHGYADSECPGLCADGAGSP
mmetsp:Transcript_91675/g.238958  ORF Transcript_91675/g.238958 Transcript_91675/m.238958 type:complete len:225 (-) Transcript_91675:1583-2257(-)